jgi:dephospho-CoA kinase
MQGIHGVGVTGYSGAGKTTVARAICERLDAAYVNVGDVVHDHVADALGKDADGDRISEWIAAQSDEYGYSADNRWVLDRLRALDHGRHVVIDGVRKTDGLDRVTGYFDRFDLVLVDCPFEERLRRVEARDREERNSSKVESLAERDRRERRYGIGEILAEERYDHRVDNSRRRDALSAEVAAVVECMTA